MTTTISKKDTGKQVGTKHVDQLISAYKKERWLANSQKLGRSDSLSVWYGMDELSTFLDLARKHNADGIKMYHGVYPSDDSVPEAMQGLQTVVLVATKTITTGHSTTNKDIYIEKNGTTEILAFNLGELCPPFCSQGFPPRYDDGVNKEKIGLTLLRNKDKIIVI